MAVPQIKSPASGIEPVAGENAVVKPGLRRGRAMLIAALCSASALVAHGGARLSAQGASPESESEPGIPVTDALTLEKCGTCHAADTKGNLSRISWSRTTPEGWAQAIKRMVKLNGLSITPEESRKIVRYLATNHGLAPEEARPVMYLVEHRMADEAIPGETVRQSCAACHAFAQPLSWRRSPTEWKLLQNLHVALYSQADAQYRRVATDEPGPTGPVPITQKPGAIPVTAGEVGLKYITRTAPLHTPEWAAWKPRIQNPRLAGKWLVSAWAPGKGRFVGEMTVQPGASPEEFTTGISLKSLADGSTLTRTGNGVVYAGYSWRGKSAPAGATGAAAPDSFANATREAVWFAPDRQSAEGRWFWGAYDEFGFDVKLIRADGSPTLAAIAPVAVKAGAKGVEVRILGDSLPGGLTAADIDLGAGIAVKKIVSASPSEVVVTVDAAPDAVAGRHDVSVRGAVLAAALPVYRKVDYLKVTPETGVSRLGGVVIPKGYAQFDAIGFDNGPDGKRGTPDDVDLGTVDVAWSMEEFQSVYFDDDKDYVGTLSPAALFTPNVDGPNGDRPNNRNNYGDVWVVATAKSEKDAQGRPLTARAHLVVTVPAYKRWDQPEVAQ